MLGSEWVVKFDSWGVLGFSGEVIFWGFSGMAIELGVVGCSWVGGEGSKGWFSLMSCGSIWLMEFLWS